MDHCPQVFLKHIRFPESTLAIPETICLSFILNKFPTLICSKDKVLFLLHVHNHEYFVATQLQKGNQNEMLTLFCLSD